MADITSDHDKGQGYRALEMTQETRRRPELTAPPARIARLPLDVRGYPIPWFVSRLPDGTPEFRAMDGGKFSRAIREKRCWICGDPLGGFMVFVVGPMCGINRTSSEPPSHRECAVWAAINCPFLSRPQMVRRENNVPEDAHYGAAALTRNPGVTLLWTTRHYRTFKAPVGAASGYLIQMGDPLQVEWFSEGRHASRAEVLASIADGVPALERACENALTPMDRLNAHLELKKAAATFEKFLPAA